jgi:hypothetical protein
MRKANKIMMATVSTLLALTLISGCLVSGIFAKYTTQKKSVATMKYQKMGVEVTLSVPQETALRAQGAVITYPAENSNKVKAGVYEVTISGLPIGPGDDYRKLVRFDFDGNANVPVEVKLSTDIVYSDDNMWLVSTDKGIFDEDYYCLPLGFHCYAYYDGAVVGDEAGFSLGDPWRARPADEADNTSAANRAKNIAKNMRTHFNFDSGSNNLTYVTKSFSPDKNNGEIVFYTNSTSAPINSFEMGYWWPFEDEGKEESTYLSSNTNTRKNQINNISTYLAQKNENATITITYTVTVTQTAAAT